MNVRDMEVLNIIYAAGKPITSSDIVNCKRELTQSTVIAVLRNLEKNEAVEVVGTTHAGKVMARQFAPGPKAKEEITLHYAEEFTRTKDVLSVEEMREIVERVYSNTDI